ncbi:hypothetical protein SOVF_162720 [Spinacia oleracea]|nr:hypothetical protein SOVF_162720 [Spinacia oleracea]
MVLLYQVKTAAKYLVCQCEAYGRHSYSTSCQKCYFLKDLKYFPGSDLYVRLATTTKQKAKRTSYPSVIAPGLGGLSLIIAAIIVLVLLITKTRSRTSVHASLAEQARFIDAHEICYSSPCN